MDGSQPLPDTVGSSLPVFILEMDGVSPLTHPGRLTGCPTQVMGCVCVFVCVCVCVCVHAHGHLGAGVWGSVCLAILLGSACPLSRSAGVRGLSTLSLGT